jgi:glycosyltransferase involved in cell wall biosynthesis
MPKVSIVLPIYNGSEYLSLCLDSLLAQSFRDFEILLIDDGSKDNSCDISQKYQARDSRIRHFENSTNLGTASTTNIGHRLAQGSYIAHADQDDISEPQRLALQVAFLDKNPETAMVSGSLKSLGTEEEYLIKAPLSDDHIKSNFLPGTHNIINPTVMIRRSFTEPNQLYFDPNLQGVADYGYFVQAMLCGAKFANLPQVLLRYRIHSSQQTKGNSRMAAAFPVVRQRVMTEFFPELSLRQIQTVEPLLRWTWPPALPRQDVEAGLELIPQLMAYEISKHGESREQRNGFLQSCQKRWSGALGKQKGGN